MNALRKDFFTNNWVIIAPARAQRTKHTEKVEQAKPVICPFDEGNEKLTPSEVFRIGEGRKNGSGWLVRVVPNKFPILKCHEVIIHSPSHNQDIAQLSNDQVLRIFEAYLSRYQFYSQKRFPFIYNNRGEEAAATLSHPHSQLIVFDKIPPAIEEELTGAFQYFEKYKKCIFCDFLKRELNYQKRIVLKSNNFCVVAPFASFWPYQLLILPLKHEFDFGKIGKKELSELSVIFKQILSALNNELDNPSYNFWLHSMVRNKITKEKKLISKIFHWHWEIIPRVKKLGGVELGAKFGVYDKMTPEGVTRALRKKLKNSK